MKRLTKINNYYLVLNPYAQAVPGEGHHEMDGHHEVALYPVAIRHQMSSNLSGCGQQQTKEINCVQKINYPYISPWSQTIGCILRR